MDNEFVQGPLIEALRNTLDNLRDPYEEYAYGDWTQCTCGHVYRGVFGHEATFPSDVHTSKDVTFNQVLQFIIEANDLFDYSSDDIERDDPRWVTKGWLAGVVSAATSDLAIKAEDEGIYDCKEDDARREIAIRLIETALREAEADAERRLQLSLKPPSVVSPQPPVPAVNQLVRQLVSV